VAKEGVACVNCIDSIDYNRHYINVYESSLPLSRHRRPVTAKMARRTRDGACGGTGLRALSDADKLGYRRVCGRIHDLRAHASTPVWLLSVGTLTRTWPSADAPPELHLRVSHLSSQVCTLYGVRNSIRRDVRSKLPSKACLRRSRERSTQS
jgi:hypothetical protein